MKKKTTNNEIIDQLDKHADTVLKRRSKKDTRVKKDKTRVKGDYHLDLRQDIAWELYVDPRSATFNNALQSALKAGYSPSHAKTITTEEWWTRRVKLLTEMLPRAEEVILEDLNLDTYTTITLKGNKPEKKGKRKGKRSDEDVDDDEDFDDMQSGGAEEQTISIINPKLRKIRQEASFFIAETVGRKKYHKKVEVEANQAISLVEGNEAIDKLFEIGFSKGGKKKK